MPTAKRQKYLDKQKKKLENIRTEEERKEQTDKIKTEFEKVGIPNSFPEVIKFYNILDEFVNNGMTKQGKIPIEGVGKIIVYQLTNNKKYQISAMLKHDDNI